MGFKHKLKFMQDDQSNTDPQSSVPTPPKAEPETNNLDLTLPEPPNEPEKPSRFFQIKTWIVEHKKVSIPIALLCLIIILAAIPWSRYQLAGLIIKKDFQIQVMDQTAGTPVSGAAVASGNVSGQTNGNGIAVLHLPVGKHQFKVTKKYYITGHVAATVPLFGRKSTKLELVATGRQVRVTLKDTLSGKALSDVDILVADISARTDVDGKALLVVPAGVSKEQANLSLAGYNDTTATLTISDKNIEDNPLNMTPVGKVYFLSKRTGKLNVMKANLDGTDPEVVVAATGQEQVDSSALSQSPDGRYVALETQRSAADKVPQLYVISTADDRLLTFDSGDFDFSIVGWSGDDLVYRVSNNEAPAWQAGQQKIKSYDASTGKTYIIDSSAGTDPDKSAGESYGEVFLTASKVVFDKSWGSNGSDTLDGRKNTVMIADPTGQNKQTVSNYDASSTNIFMFQYAPNGFYIESDDSGTGDSTYYDYIPGGGLKKINAPTSDQLYNNPAYYFSPPGNQTYWSERRDGKSTLITADAYGSAGSQKILSVGYEAAGWYTDKYVLATNDDQNELYILSASGGKPVKISDYQSTYIY